MFRMRVLLLLIMVSSSCGGPLYVNEQLINPEAMQRTRCVAVLPFVNATTTTVAGALAANAVSQALLQSGHVNALAPDEVVQQLAAMNLMYVAVATPMSAQTYGQALGVDAVIMGTVTEMGASPGTTNAKGPVVGFVASLVSVANGTVLWTSTASNYHHAVWLETHEPRDILLREAARAAVSDLLDSHRDASGPLLPCAKLPTQPSQGAPKASAPGH